MTHRVLCLGAGLLIGLTTFVLLLQTLRSVQAAVITVNPGDSIQAAIDAAAPGDTVVVRAGIYTESITLDKPVSVTGVNSETVIVHPLPDNTFMTVTGAATGPSVVISGFTIQGGGAASQAEFDAGLGIGILVKDGARPSIQHLTFIEMQREWSAGIAARAGSPLTVENVHVTDIWGLGIFSEDDVTVKDSHFFHNAGGILVREGDLQVTRTAMISHFVAVSATQITMDDVFVSRVDASQSEYWELLMGDTAGYAFSSPIQSPIQGTNIWINGSTIKESGSFDAAVIHTTGNTTIRNSLFQNNLSYQSNRVRASVVFATELVSVTDSTFQNNVTAIYLLGLGEDYSDASAITSDNTIWVNSTIFENNVCRYRDPNLIDEFCSEAAVIQADNITVNLSSFISNTNGILCGAVCGYTVRVYDSEFRQNQGLTAADISLKSGEIKNTTFISTVGGASIFHYGPGSVTIEGSKFLSNTIGDDRFDQYRSRAVLISGYGSLTVTDSIIEGNQRRDMLVLSIWGFLHLDDTIIRNNQVVLYPGTPFYGTKLIRLLNSHGALENNLFINNDTGQGPTVADITLDWTKPNTSTLEFRHNTVIAQATLSDFAFAMEDGTITLTNNIFADIHTIGLITGGVMSEDYNLFHEHTTVFSGSASSGSHSLIGLDPLFVDPAAGNYRLQPGSPAIDAALDVGVTTDFDGNPRPGSGSTLSDIGAFEFQALLNKNYLPLVRR